MRTAIYCRVSSPGQKNTTSLPEQERINREHAAQLGWEVSEAHVYHEVEGAEDLYRPQMDRLWEAIEAREIDAVVIDVTDRLSRDEGDQGAVYHHADRHGVTIELSSEDLDESEHGRNLRTLAGINARMEHAAIRRRTQRGRKARAASGKMFAGAWPLYGYQWGDPEKGKRTYYVVDPETAPVVVRIFNMVADGTTIRQVSQVLEREGVPTQFQVLASRDMLPASRTASPIWWRGQVRSILKNPAYWGEHSAYRHKSTKEKVRPADTGITRKVRRTTERATDDPDRVALPNACPALVSKELAERAQAQLAKNKTDNPTRNKDPLATIWRTAAFCGHCGGRMFTAPGSAGRRYYCRSRIAKTHGGGTLPMSCPGGWNSMHASALDPRGWADVRAWLSNEKNVSRLLTEWEQEEKNVNNSAASRLEASAATIRDLCENRNNLIDTIAATNNRDSRRVLQERLDQLSERISREEGKRERLMAEAKEAVDRAKDARDIREWVTTVASHADTFTRLEQVAVLHALDAQVMVWRADHVHEDNWPQRYKITLHFTGFTGQPVTLPPVNSDSHYL